MVSQDLYHKAAEIFLSVVDLPADKQAAALDRACGGEAQLRAEVESLLRYHLEQGHPAPPRRLTAPPPAGDAR